MTMKPHEETGSEKKGIRHILSGTLIVVGVLLVLGIVVQVLWNWLMPQIFGLRMITYPQALGLLVLSRLLVGRMGQKRDHAGYLTGRYGFRRIVGGSNRECGPAENSGKNEGRGSLG